MDPMQTSGNQIISFSMDDFVTHQVRLILRESREQALRAATNDERAGSVPHVGEVTNRLVGRIAKRKTRRGASSPNRHQNRYK